MGRLVDVDDLIDAREAAQLLGLRQSTSVTTYLHRYSDMPRPVVEKAHGRTRLWLSSELRAWQLERRRR